VLRACLQIDGDSYRMRSHRSRLQTLRAGSTIPPRVGILRIATGEVSRSVKDVNERQRRIIARALAVVWDEQMPADGDEMPSDADQTGVNAVIAGVRMAGKTGTVQLRNASKSGCTRGICALRRPLARVTLTASAAAMVLCATASARMTELGQLPDGARGTCPDSCQAVSHTTAYQVKVGPDRALYRAPANGRIVAWTLALGAPNPQQVAFYTKQLGGPATAAIVVLASEAKLKHRMVAKSPLMTLTPFLGRTVEFPLDMSLPILKGQYVALNVPSWAPILKLEMGLDTSWRSSRPRDACSDATTQTALVGRRTFAVFGCLFFARLTYSAKFIPTP
jgi:hypothetical protein